MSSLFNDLQFCIYGAGLLLGLMLLPVLRGRRRASQGGVDPSLAALGFQDAGAFPQPVRMVAPAPVSAPVQSINPEQTAAFPAQPNAFLSALDPQAAASAPAPAPAVDLRASPAKNQEASGLTGAFKPTASGNISPAVVYLQNLKNQMEHFEKEIQQLRSQVASFTQKNDTQFDALLTRMNELQGGLHQAQEHVAAKIEPAPAVEEQPAPAPEPAPEPEPAPQAAEPAQGLKLDLPDAAPSPSPQPQPEPASEDILKPVGKGPVWPV